MSDMRTFIKVEHSRFTLILRKGMLPFHWIAESHVYPDKGYVTAVRERTNYGAVWTLSSRGALDQVMLSIWEDIEWLDVYAISCLQQLRTTLGLQDRKEHGR